MTTPTNAKLTFTDKLIGWLNKIEPYARDASHIVPSIDDADVEVLKTDVMKTLVKTLRVFGFTDERLNEEAMRQRARNAIYLVKRVLARKPIPLLPETRDALYRVTLRMREDGATIEQIAAFYVDNNYDKLIGARRA